MPPSKPRYARGHEFCRRESTRYVATPLVCLCMLVGEGVSGTTT